MRGNRGLWNGQASSYVKRLPHKTIYMVTKMRCHWNKTFLLGPIFWNKVITCFISPLFIMFLHICEMPTKASNAKWTFYYYHWECNCVQKVIPVVAIPFWNLPWFTEFGKIHLEKTLLGGIHRLQGINFTVTLKELNPHNCTNWLRV